VLHEGVEAGGGLVQDEQLGIPHQRLHEPHLLAIAFGQGANGPVELEIEALCQLLRLFPRGPTAQMGEVGEELPGSQTVVQGKVAGQIADSAPDGHALASGVETEQADAPGVGPDQVQQQADRGGLSGAVWPEEPEDLTSLHVESDVVDAASASVVLRHRAKGDRRNDTMIAGLHPCGRGRLHDPWRSSEAHAPRYLTGSSARKVPFGLFLQVLAPGPPTLGRTTAQGTLGAVSALARRDGPLLNTHRHPPFSLRR
jgi:hypothetical protein